MGLYAVDIDIDCIADDGTPLKFTEQVMDAFIGYGGKGEPPPCVITIKQDRLARKPDGSVFDPVEMGYEYNDELILGPDYQIWRIVVEQGAVTVLARNDG
jgi:hypothetical protein